MELEAGNIAILISVLTAIGALYKYISYNEGQDKLQLDVIINLLDNNVGEVVTRIENKGKVRAKILMKDLTWMIKLHTTIATIRSGSQQGQNGGKKIGPEQYVSSNDLSDYTWVNGLTTQVYRDYFTFTEDIVYVEATVMLKYQDQEREWQTTRKIVKVKPNK